MTEQEFDSDHPLPLHFLPETSLSLTQPPTQPQKVPIQIGFRRPAPALIFHHFYIFVGSAFLGKRERDPFEA
jgi:hypothetical protein